MLEVWLSLNAKDGLSLSSRSWPSIQIRKISGKRYFCSLPLTPATPFLPHTNCSPRFYLSPNQVCNVNINPNPRHLLSLFQHAQPWPGWKMSPGRTLFMFYPFLAALGYSTPSAFPGMISLILLIQHLTLSPFLNLGWVLGQGIQPWPRWEISQWKFSLQTTHPFSSSLLTLPRMVILGSGIFLLLLIPPSRKIMGIWLSIFSELCTEFTLKQLRVTIHIRQQNCLLFKTFSISCHNNLECVFIGILLIYVIKGFTWFCHIHLTSNLKNVYSCKTHGFSIVQGNH